MNSRRTFLQSFAVVPALAAGCATAQRRDTPVNASNKSKPQRIIHLVADGMSAGMLSCAHQFSQLDRGRGLTWFDLASQPNASVAFMDMRSQNSLVTDSSAASSVWGSGVRIPNGKVNQTSDGTSLVTLYQLLAQEGWKRGLVTSTELTHATPAGFAACTNSRDNADIIAAQYLDRNIEVLLGGGRKFFAAETHKDKRDLIADYRAKNYSFLQTAKDLASAPADGKWIGLFANSHLPYEVDRLGGITKVEVTPSLAQMTSAALRNLRRSPNFILQVEGGRVDHACHARDGASAVREMIAFDEAVEVCLAFQRESPETLLVLTTDHATGNPGLNGSGSGYADSSKLLRNIKGVRQSTGELVKALKKADAPDNMISVLSTATGYKASEARIEMLRPFMHGQGVSLYGGDNSDTAALSQVLANHIGINFTGGAHTSDLIPVVAFGPGADAFHGQIEGPDIFFRYTDFANIRFRNPQEALQLSNAAREHDAVTDMA